MVVGNWKDFTIFRYSESSSQQVSCPTDEQAQGTVRFCKSTAVVKGLRHLLNCDEGRARLVLKHVHMEPMATSLYI